MSACPVCREQNAPGVAVCKVCHQPMTKKCPLCAEEIQVDALKCKHCQSDFRAEAGEGKPAGSSSKDLPLGKERSVIVVILLGFVTFGIYAIVHWFKIAGEINRHSGVNKLSPWMDFLLIFPTCGIWMWVMCYKYPKAVYEMQVREEIPATDHSTICLILAFFGLSIAAPLMVQSELNNHWRFHDPARG